MRVAVDAARRVAPELLRHRRVRIGVLAERVHLLLAEEAVAAGDVERHHHAIPWAQVPDVAANIDHLAHELVAEDVSLLHPWNETAVQMQVPAAGLGGTPGDGRGLRQAKAACVAGRGRAREAVSGSPAKNHGPRRRVARW